MSGLLFSKVILSLSNTIFSPFFSLFLFSFFQVWWGSGWKGVNDHKTPLERGICPLCTPPPNTPLLIKLIQSKACNFTQGFKYLKFSLQIPDEWDWASRTRQYLHHRKINNNLNHNNDNNNINDYNDYNDNYDNDNDRGVYNSSNPRKLFWWRGADISRGVVGPGEKPLLHWVREKKWNFVAEDQ